MDPRDDGLNAIFGRRYGNPREEQKQNRGKTLEEVVNTRLQEISEEFVNEDVV